jgi:hypothetical protein
MFWFFCIGIFKNSLTSIQAGFGTNLTFKPDLHYDGGPDPVWPKLGKIEAFIAFANALAGFAGRRSATSRLAFQSKRMW